MRQIPTRNACAAATILLFLTLPLALHHHSAHAADNYDDITTTLIGDWANYGAVTTYATDTSAMASYGLTTSTNAASGTLTTSGKAGHGMSIHNYSEGQNHGTITTSGEFASGIMTGIYSTVSNHGTISTTGQRAHGINVYGACTVTNSGHITTTGENAHGVFLNGPTDTVLNSGSIAASGNGAHAILAYSSTVHLLTGTRILAGDVWGTSSTLTLDGLGTVDFDIGGTWNALTKTGAGTWSFTRDISATPQSLRLEGGTLAIARGVGLRGDSYTQNAGTTLLVAPDGTTTPLTVTNAANLDGALLVQAVSTAIGTTATVLHAGSGVSGTFDSVRSMDTNPNFTLRVDYGSNDVTVTQNYTPQWDSSALGLASTLTTARGFATIAATRGAMMLSQAPAPEREILIAGLGSTDGLLLPRDDDSRLGMYLQPVFASGSRDEGAGGIGYDWDTMGFEIGLDYLLTPELLLGIMGGYATTDIDFTGSAFVANDTEEQETCTLGVYGAWGPGNWRITDVLSVARVEHDSRRNAGLGQTAEGDSTSWILGNQFRLAHVWTPQKWEITPHVGLNTTHLSREGFSETGALNAVRYDDFDKTFWEGVVGAQIRHAFHTDSGAVITPFVGLDYGFALNDNDITMRQYLPTDSALVTTENDDEHISVELGLSLARGPLGLTVAFTEDHASNSETRAARATLRVEF
ncbi:uncharacterized protein YhjY with autotransporter beta-barrel domain [Desulfobaculum xiamenense]|uniref:Uncharacterized protein YhjY with autotransporter beta-barrel domain n=1 Tax=Desulfobaculum xiamenense TaxID=995050 RepID=A0A846QQ80_9BACT|nr:autotransporter outer membrane beta-barrel domain-containing protein [Desulfobaculum xiamenense]NJB69140.1 uncharacterized protein YhjY with autotransporter beta-barrel domain [Desulfobaculum xiamenense]